MNAVNMYKKNQLWEEALRVVKTHGSNKEVNDFAKNWAESLGKDKGIKFLMKIGLIESAIDYLIDLKDFDEALTLANMNAKHKINDIYYKQAQKYEDEKRFKEAEELYIKSGKPKEAIQMYEFQKEWTNAMKIAKRYDTSALQDIYINQAKWHLDRKELNEAENCFLQSKNYDAAINVYLEKRLFEDALRLAKKYNIERITEINNMIARGDLNGLDDKLKSAEIYEEQREYRKAIST